MRYLLVILFLLTLPMGAAQACTGPPAGVEGEVIFNTSNNIPAYCDGTNWIAMTGGEDYSGYSINGISLNTVDKTSVRSGGWSPLTTNSNTFTGSFWVRQHSWPRAANGFVIDSNADMKISMTTGGEISFTLRDDPGTIALQFDTPVEFDDTEWHHIMFSFDLSDTGRRHVYIDGSAATITYSTYVDLPVNFDVLNFTIGSHRNGVQDFSDVDFADFYFNFSEYIDLSVAANRERFIDTSGNPVYMGANGELPTGSSPDIFLSGDTANWHTNKGTGGGFSVNGGGSAPLDDALTSPNPPTQLLPSGLIAHWRLDETSGTTVYDTSVNSNDGDLQGSMDAANDSVAGLISNALDFDGSDDIVFVNHDASLNPSGTELTSVFWIKPNVDWDTIPNDTFWLMDKHGSDVGWALAINGNSDENIYIRFGTGASSTNRSSSGLDWEAGQWYQIAVVINATADTISYYRNGALVSTSTSAGVTGIDWGTQSLRFGGDSTGYRHDAKMDDVRIYERALTDAEILELYQARDGIRYNENQRTMEYFDGNRFVSMTPEWPEPNPTPSANTDPICTPSVQDFQSFEDNTAQTTYTFSNYSFTDTANGQILVVTTGSESGEDVTGVTFNGTPLTEAVDTADTISSTGAAIYYLPNPPNVTGDIVATYGTIPSNRAGITAMVLDCVDPATAPITSSTTGTTATMSDSITTVTANTLIIDNLIHEENSSVLATTETGQTALISEELGTGTEWAVSWKLAGTPGSSTMGWSGAIDTRDSALALAGFAADPNSIPTNNYVANAVTFDGTNDYLQRGGTLTGLSDCKSATSSFWARRNGNFGSIQFVWDGGGSNVYHTFSTTNRLEWVFTSGSVYSSSTITDNDWHHYLVSFDVQAGVAHLYIDDVDDLGANTLNDVNLNFAQVDHFIGIAHNSTGRLNADIADLYIDFCNYTDFSIEANRRAFIDENGRAVYLGADGSNPTGSAPDIFLSGDTDNWHTNKGTGGGFTENGELTSANAVPGDGISQGLIGHWKLDETSGTVATDETGNMDVSGFSSTDFAVHGATGLYDGALDGTQEQFIGLQSGPIPASYVATGAFTVSVWAKAALFNSVGGFFSIEDYFELGHSNSDPSAVWLRLQAWSGGTATDTANVSRFNLDEWVHLAVTYDYNDGISAVPIFYVNGVAETTSTWNTPPSGTYTAPALQNISIGKRWSSSSSGFRGRIDEVRYYDRVLNADEITQLYQMGTPLDSSTALPLGCPNIGDTCDDGTIYAGVSAEGNTVEMYTTPFDGPFAMTWNDGGSDWVATGTTNGNTGESNTIAIVTTDSNGVTAGFQLHEAAQYCYDLVAHGADDWYLPADIELRRMCQNSDVIPNFTLTSGNPSRYNSSTEDNTSQASFIQFSSCGFADEPKNNPFGDRRTRCVRKGPAPRCANPYGIEGQKIYNTDHDVVQYCDGARWRAIGKYP